MFKYSLISFSLISIIFLASISSIHLSTPSIGEQLVSAKEIERTNAEPRDVPFAESTSCHPNSGWTWTQGPTQPEIASQVQQTLTKMDLETLVEAKTFGEIDSCGAFQPYAVDFTIHIKSNNLINTAAQQMLIEKIRPVLVEYGKPNLGNAEIVMPQGNTIHLSNEKNNLPILDSETENISQPESLQSNTAEVTTSHIDAELSWQSTGVSIAANDTITLEVTSGLWTHWLGVKPYNNGIGENYICADILPPNQCAEPLPDAPKGSLIGQIGSHTFLIGSGTTIVAPVSGVLYMRINDEDAGLFDNDGILAVDVTAPYSTPSPIPPQENWMIRKVYVVVYDPLLSNSQLLSDSLGWNDHETLTQDTINFFEQASNNQLTYTVVDTTVITSGWPEKIDGFQYTEAEYLSVIGGQSSAHSPDAVNYNAIVNDPDLDICGRANRGEIDEVWIYNGPYFGFYESILVGPGAYWYNSSPVPGPHDCNRLIPIMGPSPERGIDSAIHNFGHRSESAMQKVYGSWQQNRIAHNWERFALVDFLSPNYSYSGCGNIHFPPNGTSDYDYGNSGTANTNCDDFSNYPDLSDPINTVQPVTCSTWGCSGEGYLDYWFSHLPETTGCGSDNVANNWWRYIVEPSRALDPSSLCYGMEGPGGVGDTSGVTELALWLQADSGVYTDAGCTPGTEASAFDIVACWADQSGRNNHGTNVANGPALQTAVINNQPTLHFNGSKYLDSAFDLNGRSGFTFFEVSQAVDQSGYQSILRFQNAANSYIVYPDANQLSLSSETAIDAGFVANEWNMGTAVYKLDTINGMRTFHNGTFVEEQNSGSTALPADSLTIGRNSVTPGSYTNANVSELIVYDRDLSLVERTLVENYLSAKYDLPIASDKYDGDDAANDDFDRNVAGIGREFDGRHTSAESAGMIVINNTFLRDNGDYLLFGHRTATNNNTPDDIPTSDDWTGASNSHRWLRHWYVDVTDVGATIGGSVQIIFDFSDAGMQGQPAGPVSNYRLLKREEVGDPFTDIATATAFEGDRVIFDGVDVALLGSNFTLGSLDPVQSPTAVMLETAVAQATNPSLVIILMLIVLLSLPTYLVLRRQTRSNKI